MSEEFTMPEIYNRGVIAGLSYVLRCAQQHASQYHDHISPIHDFCKWLESDIEKKIPEFIRLGTVDPKYLDAIKSILGRHDCCRIPHE